MAIQNIKWTEGRIKSLDEELFYKCFIVHKLRQEKIMLDNLQDETTKDLLLSRTFLTAMMGIVVMVAKMFDVTIVDEHESIANIVEVVSVAAAIYFHTASKKKVVSIAGIKLAK